MNVSLNLKNQTVPDTALLACMEVVEKIEEEEKAAHFATLNSDKLTAIVANSGAKGTKQNTTWVSQNLQ